MRSYVIYRRVSTKSQEASGLGLEAQQRDIDLFLQNYAEYPYDILGVFTDVQSGSADDRQELSRALELTRSASGAELLVAKLDRLSRRVSFIAKLMEDRGITFRVAQMPYADSFQLHVYAALAHQEREFISQRTKAALREAKARGVKLGGDRGSLKARNDALKANADEFAQRIAKIALPLRQSGKTYTEIAAVLNENGTRTARDACWDHSSVRRVLLRVNG